MFRFFKLGLVVASVSLCAFSPAPPKEVCREEGYEFYCPICHKKMTICTCDKDQRI